MAVRRQIIPEVVVLRRKKDAGWLYTPTSVYVPYRKKKKIVRPYKVIRKRGKNTSIIGQIFVLSLAQKQWVWNPHSVVLTFNIALAQRAWRWLGNAPSLTFNLVLTVKQWVWKPNSFTNTFNISLAKQAWVWSGRQFVSNQTRIIRVINAFLKSCNRFMNRF